MTVPIVIVVVIVIVIVIVLVVCHLRALTMTSLRVVDSAAIICVARVAFSGRFFMTCFVVCECFLDFVLWLCRGCMFV